MKKYLLIVILLGLVKFLNAQTVYIDPITTAAMATSAAQLKAEQNKTNQNLSSIAVAQSTIAVQLAAAKELQDKILTGLTSVSDLVKDAVTVKYIIATTEDIVSEISETTVLAAKNPEYTVFARKSANAFYLRATRLSAEVTSVLTGGTTNMMDAGDRQQLLNHIYFELRVLYAEAFSIKYDIKWAVQKGFWNSISPFSSWVNTDKRLMDEIMGNMEGI